MFPLSVERGEVHLECANRHHGQAPEPNDAALRQAVGSWISRRGAQLHEQHERWGTDAREEDVDEEHI